MKRIGLALSSLIAAVAAALLVASCGGVRSASCTLVSVDEGRYVVQNEAILKTIPVPRGAIRVNAYSIGIPSPDACVPFHENGPPYSAFDTWHDFTRPTRMNPSAVVAFYRRVLRRGWQWRGGSGSEATFRRGNALVYVAATDETILVSVDYQGYAGRGH